MLCQQEQPDSGTIALGETVQLATVDQFRDGMDNKRTVWEEISDGLDMIQVGQVEIPSRCVGRFNFEALISKNASVTYLVEMDIYKENLQVGGNLLLLDEPTI